MKASDTWLLIEDDVDDQDFFVMALGVLTDRVNCVIAKNGLEALRIIQQDDNFLPSCIFVDLNMPKMNGFEFLQKIQEIERLAEVPRIVYTTSNAVKDKEKAFALGAQFVTKHYAISDLQQFIGDCLSLYTRISGDSANQEPGSEDYEYYLSKFERELTFLKNQSNYQKDTRNVYDLLLDSTMEMMNSDHASIQLYCNATKQLNLIATRNFHPASIDFWQTVSAASGSVCGEALRQHTCIAVSDVETTEFVREEIGIFRLSGIRAVQSFPLVADNGNLIGMISAHWKSRRQFSEKDIQSFEQFARFSSGVLSGEGVCR